MPNKNLVPKVAVDERFLTVPKAAEKLGVPVSTLRRAVMDGLIPSHRPFNSRIRVRLSEIVAAIEAANDGGPR